MTTDELARKFNVLPNTPRVSLCQRGHYLGLVPRKLPNRRLDWPDEDVERLLKASADNTTTA